ncbi:MAG: glycerophosphoryl diester phosphodiesterase membrane domain-containing protein [Terriglobales bacterium]
MITPLRPMSTGEILDRTFNLYRNNFVLFAGIAVLPPALMLVVQLIQAGMVATPGHPRAAGAGAVAGGLGMMVGWFAYLVGMAVAHAATVFAVSAVHLERTTTIGESYGRVRGHYGRIVWVLIQASLRAFWPLMIVIVVFVAAIATTKKGASPGAFAVVGLTGLLVFAAAVVGIVLNLRYALAVPACVLEDIKASAAIKRSVTLSRGSRGQIFVIYFLMAVITYIVMFVFLIPATFLAAVVAKGAPAVATLTTGLAMFFAGALAGPIATIALSLVYFDQRVRKEAFDLQLMMAAVDGTALPGAQVASAG